VGLQVAARRAGYAAALVAAAGASASARADGAGDGADWHLAVGPGLYSMPRYPGAGSTRTRFLPYVDAEYHHRFYTSVADLIGVYAVKTDAVQAGAALEYDPTERPAGAGLPRVRDTARLKLFASRTVSFVTFDGNVARDVLGRGQGLLAQANLWLTAPLTPDLSVNAGPGATWADAQYMRSFFGTRAGLVDVHLNGYVEWRVTPHYQIGMLAYLARLKGDAAASPVTDRRGQPTLMGWVAYRFR
jgi:outer membrane scaffolding protein for murein synthesis (MipA/OmpV family)